MLRLLTPIILVIAAIGLFSVYTNPTYQHIKELEVENNSYEDALTKAKDLHKIRDELLAARDNFSPDDLLKLQRILPDNIDNIRLIIDMSNIASRHKLAITNVDLGDLSKQKESAATGGTGSPVGSLTLGFAVSTNSYDEFLSFMQDLEHSVRLVDVTKLDFTTTGGSGGAPGVVTYTLTFRTYWLHSTV